MFATPLGRFRCRGVVNKDLLHQAVGVPEELLRVAPVGRSAELPCIRIQHSWTSMVDCMVMRSSRHQGRGHVPQFVYDLVPLLDVVMVGSSVIGRPHRPPWKVPRATRDTSQLWHRAPVGMRCVPLCGNSASWLTAWSVAGSISKCVDSGVRGLEWYLRRYEIVTPQSSRHACSGHEEFVCDRRRRSSAVPANGIGGKASHVCRPHVVRELASV